MTQTQFAQYQLLIIGDSGYGEDDPSVGEALASASVWEPVVMASGGNKVLLGVAPTNAWEPPENDGYAPFIEADGIAYAGAVAGATGAYIDLDTAYYAGDLPEQPFDLLNGLSTFGSNEFSVIDGVILGSTDTSNVVTSGFGSSSTGAFDDYMLDGEAPWELFAKYPPDWTPIAISPSGPNPIEPATTCGWDASAVVCGLPDILASGVGLTPNPGEISSTVTASEQGGASSQGEKQTTCDSSLPVNCATGVFWHTFQDARVPGPGLALDFTRTYSSSDASVDGPLGYGWTDSYNMSLSLAANGAATVNEANGSQVPFYSNGSGGFSAPPRVLATLTANSDGTYAYVRYDDHLQYLFNSAGELISETDRNGYTTTLSYTGGLLTSVTDPVGRSLTLSYTGSQISQISDRAGNTWTYSYDANGNLESVVAQSGSYSTTWSYTYDTNHLLDTMTDPDNGVTTNTYNGSGQVIQQQDPAGGVTTWSYSGNPASIEGSTTTITDPDGNVTVENYQNLELQSMTRGYGSGQAATTDYQYGAMLDLTVEIDNSGFGSENSYDSHGSVLATSDSRGDTWVYTYNGLDEIATATDPDGVTTTNTYDSSGNLLSKSTPLTGGGTANWGYAYNDASLPGMVSAITDPDFNTSSYGYDQYGNLTSVTDAKGNETSYSYDQIGERTSMVSPAGNAPGANPASYTTSYSYQEAPFEVTKVTNPVGAGTLYGYNGDGALTSVTDANGNQTTYVLDPDNRVTRVNEPGSGSPHTSTSYYGDGAVHTQTDASGKTTTYTEDALGRVASMTDPANQTTSYSYDDDGDLVTLLDPEGQTTTYDYDVPGEAYWIRYSDQQTPDVYLQYDADGEPTSMSDGTGTTSYTYDTLGQLTSITDGHGDTVGYTYDADGNETSTVYPNGKTVTRTFDNDERLQAVTDWLGDQTTFNYDPDSNLTTTTFPAATGGLDKYGYNAADQPTSIAIDQGSSTLASLSYTLDALGQPQSISQTGLPGAASITYAYTPLEQLQSAGSNSYSYNGAGEPTQIEGTSLSYDTNGYLQSVTTASANVPVQYNPDAQRAQGASPQLSAEGYSYDQAGRLIQAAPPSYAAGLIAGGQNHSLAVRADGTVWASGENNYGQLGNNTSTNSKVPVKVSNLTTATAVAGGADHSLALSSAGTVWGWGQNNYGQLGNNTTTNSKVPVQISNLSTATAISANDSGSHSLALTSAAAVWAWGENNYGQLGNNTTTNAKVPVQVSNLTAVSAIAAGGDHSLALKTAGTVWAWGENNYGQLGNNTTTNSKVPVQVSSLTGVSAIAAGSYYNLALKSNGTVWAWGENNNGQLGNNTTTNAQVPVQVSGLSNVVEIAAGGGQSLALESNGTLWAWGANNYGQLANGTWTNSETPVQITGLTGVDAIAAGANHSLFATAVGGVLAAGYNNYGQLGNNTTDTFYLALPVENLLSITRQGGATYAYNGDGLRTSSISNRTTSYDVWNTTGSLPLLLSDGTNSYIYGPDNLPIEQISTGGTVSYLHHDQIGSTRLITNSTGQTAATFTYNPYGTLQASTGTTTTPLGYAGQPTDPQSGLQYDQARYYDPTTGQFLTVDPLVETTRQPYLYGNDNPLGFTDPSGLATQSCVGFSVQAGLSVSIDSCSVSTPGGSGHTFTIGLGFGPGAGVEVHYGTGVSNACTPQDYGGFFGSASGSTDLGSGGYANGFVGPGSNGQPVLGGTAGPSAGLGTGGSVGGTYTFVAP